ncbi:MAG: hypothetical protein AB9891_20050 [Anaerolineaceae bacterium]
MFELGVWEIVICSVPLILVGGILVLVIYLVLRRKEDYRACL